MLKLGPLDLAKKPSLASLVRSKMISKKGLLDGPKNPSLALVRLTMISKQGPLEAQRIVGLLIVPPER